MRVGTPGFVPERLIEARAARRIPSKIAFARLIGVHPSSVTRWEDGTSAPDAEMLGAISAELRVRREFFLRPTYNQSRPLFFRTLSSVLVRDTDYQMAQMNWLHEISALVQHYVDFPAVDIPDVLNGATYKQLRDEDIEQIALDLRRHWGMGEGPCVDVVALLERIGCVVGSIEMGTTKLDGLCSWADSDHRPHILLATDKMSLARRQMDAAHELGHAILHKNVGFDDLKRDLKDTIEPQAFRFASAFLLPSTTYPHEVKHTSLASLQSLKARWRVSIKAQIKRLTDLDIIAPDQATYLYKLYSMKGWAREEPLDREWPIPGPKTLADALNLIIDSGTRTKTDLLSTEFTMQAGDIENLANLPYGWFSRDPVQILQLKTAAPTKAAAPGTGGTIIPFERK